MAVFHHSFLQTMGLHKVSMGGCAGDVGLATVSANVGLLQKKEGLRGSLTLNVGQLCVISSSVSEEGSRRYPKGTSGAWRGASTKGSNILLGINDTPTSLH